MGGYDGAREGGGEGGRKEGRVGGREGGREGGGEGGVKLYLVNGVFFACVRHDHSVILGSLHREA